MPELPEVETSRRGIEPHVLNRPITDVIIRRKKLRWPVPTQLKKQLVGEHFSAAIRRGKYILLPTDNGTLILHLGMTGSLRIMKTSTAPAKHDHVELVFADGNCLRLNDPRCFGAVLWTTDDPYQHELIRNLGPEPLTDEFTPEYLFKKSRGRKQAIKTFIMDSKIVVGVGNIYANEALFMAGIRPRTAAGRLSKTKYTLLVEKIRFVLARSIELGGTTLRDFLHSDGKPGYFAQQLLVYGRGNKPCRVCDTNLKEIRLGQRSTVYCPACQK